jgi:hypothetical protein
MGNVVTTTNTRSDRALRGVAFNVADRSRAVRRVSVVARSAKALRRGL